MGENIKAIQTYYNGYHFRSRTEARWAVFFDNANIRYQYEPEGYELSDGTRYLPDFYHPESNTFFECKGIMSDDDYDKITTFQKDMGVAVVIGYSDMTFQASHDWSEDEFEIAVKDESYIIECPNCGRVFFLTSGGSYACRCCRHYEGDSIFAEYIRGDLKDWTGGEYMMKCIEKAKQARFEHGEMPIMFDSIGA